MAVICVLAAHFCLPPCPSSMSVILKAAQDASLMNAAVEKARKSLTADKANNVTVERGSW